MKPGPIRLQRGWDEPSINDGAGEIHIEARHGIDVRNLKDDQGRQIYAGAAELVRDVALHYNRIARGHSGRLVLGMANGKEKIIIIELDRVGDGYVVGTAGLRNKGWMENPIRALPWRRTDPSTSRRPSDPGTQGSQR